MGLLAELIMALIDQNKVKVLPRSCSNGRVARNFVPLWRERNWIKRGDTYRGYYRTKYGSYQGEITERYEGSIQFFVTNPPACLARHSHASCFFPRQGNSYEIHFARKARTPDDGILAIEKIFQEAHELSMPKARYR